uniref:LigA n=1 Tax=Parastrongyloides trichosuri TaxID=131310 RepID=A0A0N4Z2U6_PARTI
MGDAHAADGIGEEVGVRRRDLIVQHIDHHAFVRLRQARSEVADQGQRRQDVDLVMKAQIRLLKATARSPRSAGFTPTPCPRTPPAPPAIAWPRSSTAPRPIRTGETADAASRPRPAGHDPGRRRHRPAGTDQCAAGQRRRLAGQCGLRLLFRRYGGAGAAGDGVADAAGRAGDEGPARLGLVGRPVRLRLRGGRRLGRAQDRRGADHHPDGGGPAGAQPHTRPLRRHGRAAAAAQPDPHRRGGAGDRRGASGERPSASGRRADRGRGPARARQARRLSHVRRGRRLPLRGQGQVVEEAGCSICARAIPHPAHRPDGVADPRDGAGGHGVRDRGPAARIQLHQEAEAALQRRAEGRQVLRRADDPARPPRAPGAQASRRPYDTRRLFRPLRLDLGGEPYVEHPAEGLPAAILFGQRL